MKAIFIYNNYDILLEIEPFDILIPKEISIEINNDLFITNLFVVKDIVIVPEENKVFYEIEAIES